MTDDPYAALALIFALVAVSSSILGMTAHSLHYVSRRRQARECEVFLQKVCQVMGADYDKIDRRDLGHLVILIELAVSMAGDPSQAACKSPVADLIYREFYGQNGKGGKP